MALEQVRQETMSFFERLKTEASAGACRRTTLGPQKTRSRGWAEGKARVGDPVPGAGGDTRAAELQPRAPAARRVWVIMQARCCPDAGARIITSRSSRKGITNGDDPRYPRVISAADRAILLRRLPATRRSGNSSPLFDEGSRRCGPPPAARRPGRAQGVVARGVRFIKNSR